MNIAVLHTAVQNFINEHLDANLNTLALKGTEFKQVSTQEIIEQIEAKNKCNKKLLSWFNATNIYYPNKVNIAQSSSELTAIYKSSLISGTSIIDLTGGFGVDAYYFSKQLKQVIHCELNALLSTIANHNFKQLQANNITCLTRDGLKYLETTKLNFDWIYLDPSRRHLSKGKVFYFKDCLPNVPEHLERLFKHSKNILIKASPMLDISIGLKELQFIKAIHIVAVNNDVKEVLFCLEKDFTGGVCIKTINLNATYTQKFSFLLQQESLAKPSYGKVQEYLYEPNRAILKSGAFNLIATELNLLKLHKHSHLYTSKKLIDFPGRRFKVINTVPYSKKTIAKIIANQKINLSTRNFPESVAQLKAKFKLKDGGDVYVFFTTLEGDKKIVVFCEKTKF